MKTRLPLMPFVSVKNTSLLVLPFLLVAMQGIVKADPVTVTEKVSPQGRGFFYDYAVMNHSSADPYQTLLSVTLKLPAGDTIIAGAIVAAPSGNEAVWEPNSGYLNLVSDALAGFPFDETVDGFSFVSPLQLGEVPYAATYFDSAQNPHVFSGVTVAPSAVPEPSSFAFLGIALLVMAGCHLRRTRRE